MMNIGALVAVHNAVRNSQTKAQRLFSFHPRSKSHCDGKCDRCLKFTGCDVRDVKHYPIEVALQNGDRLVADISKETNEIDVGIVNSQGSWIQDLATITPKQFVNDRNKAEITNGIFKVLIFADGNDEDCTHEFEIRRFDNE